MVSEASSTRPASGVRRPRGSGALTRSGRRRFRDVAVIRVAAVLPSPMPVEIATLIVVRRVETRRFVVGSELCPRDLAEGLRPSEHARRTPATELLPYYTRLEGLLVPLPSELRDR